MKENEFLIFISLSDKDQRYAINDKKNLLYKVMYQG